MCCEFVDLLFSKDLDISLKKVEYLIPFVVLGCQQKHKLCQRKSSGYQTCTLPQIHVRQLFEMLKR